MTNQFDLSAALRFFILLTDSLLRVHTEQGPHLALCLANIHVNSDSSISLGRKEVPAIAYRAPEQLGWSERHVDHRSDYYALGVIFYELLTAQFPFEATTEREMIHIQASKSPLAPNKINQVIPVVVGDIVVKLLAQQAEDRYRSLSGLAADLHCCLDMLQANGYIGYFDLARHDVANSLYISQKLYGRDAEIATLAAAFNRVAQGSTELLLLKGYPGVGKSALVNGLHAQVVNRQGYFVSGKFERNRCAIPYSAINQALRSLMLQILAESEDSMIVWRSKLLTALGTNAQLVIDEIPELEYVIGKQSPAPQMVAIRNSYHYAIQNFIRVFTRVAHPLVLFLDDLQWADSDSLALINLLMTSQEDVSLLLVGTCCAEDGANIDSGANTDSSLTQLIESARDNASVSTMTVTELSLDSVRNIVADTLNLGQDQVAQLSLSIHRKTHGNPLPVNLFLRGLHDTGLLVFKEEKWCWDIEKIDAIPDPDGLDDLLLCTYHRLSQQAQRLLQIASCIGFRFNKKILAAVSDNTPDDAGSILQEVVDAGLIRCIKDSRAGSACQNEDYLFIHDRIVHCAYTKIQDDQKAAIHLRVGRYLHEGTFDLACKDRLVDIVDHLNKGRSLITTIEDRHALAILNLSAAQAARKSAAFAAHLTYSEVAREFGTVVVWQEKPGFMCALYTELIHAAFVRADYQETVRLCKIVCDHCHDTKPVIFAKDMQIRCYAMLCQPQELLKTGIDSLALAGIRVPARLGKRHILAARLHLKLALRGRDPLLLSELQMATDMQHLLQLQVSNLFLAYGFVYLPDSDVVLWVAIQIVCKSIRYGISADCAYAFIVLARALAGRYGDTELGCQFGKVAADIATKHAVLGAVGIFHGVLRHHREALHLSLQPLMDTYAQAMEIGDRAGAMLALSFSNAIRFQSGSKLCDIVHHARKDAGVYRKVNTPIFLSAILPWAILASRLVGISMPEVMECKDEDDFVAVSRRQGDLWGVFHMRAIQSMAQYYFGDYRRAIDYSEEAMALPGFDVGTPVSGFLMFFSSLSHLAHCYEHQEHRAVALVAVAKNQQRFKPWADRAPCNYLHKWHLVEAERWRVMGKPEQAVMHFELAIDGARENGFVNDQALANELTGRYYQFNGRDMHTRMHIEEAHLLYAAWGAHAKQRQMENAYPFLLERIRNTRSDAENTKFFANEHLFDVYNVIDIYQALSSEMRLDKLLNMVTSLAVQHIGAEKGVLLLQSGDQLYVRAQAMGDVVDVESQILLQESENISREIALHVLSTGQGVVVANVEGDDRFNMDTHHGSNRPRSILCAPLQHQGQLTGILYLETCQTAKAFTDSHLRFLEKLSTPMAIALENASRYTELEQSIDLRAEALKQKNNELSQTLISLKLTQKQLVESEKLASLGQLVAGVAHEINTPVGVGVTGASTLAEETAKIERLYTSGEMKRSDLEHYVKTASAISKLLLSNMERAATLTQSFKEVAIDQTSQERRIFRLGEYIREVLLNLGPMLRKTAHHVEIKCAEFIEVDTYPGALSQILTNLVVNALLHAFNEDDVGKLSIVVTEVDDNSIELSFSDNGKGISEENLSKIFDPFFTTRRGHGGSGLGLSIIHNLATGTLAGNITVQSKLNQGTTFTLVFPRRIDSSVSEADFISSGLSHQEYDKQN